jgi:TM2 domain-containing membrane protein YozV
MSNKKEIIRIFKEEKKELRSWVMYGFIGGHHWNTSNYLQIIMFPLLMLVFLTSSALFGMEIFNNILNISSSSMDLTNLQNNQDLVSTDIILSIIPIKLGILALSSIIINISWWLYDLRSLEKKYLQQKSIFCKLEPNAKTKSVVITYLLCMILGTFGVHRFYLNKPVSGIYMLMLSLSSFLVITGLVLLIWFIYDSLTIYKEVLKQNEKIYLDKCDKL